ncbi:hypothetical protein [Azospirillum endophyticum]
MSLRELIQRKQTAVGLTPADFVLAVLPDGREPLCWGHEVLAAIERAGRAVPLIFLRYEVADMAEAEALRDRYEAAYAALV